MCAAGNWSTEDPLGIGGLLTDAYKLVQLIDTHHLHETARLESVLHDIESGLQAFVMRSLHESEAYACLSFVGGTALRFVYDRPRFSEDLNFSLENPTGYDPLQWLKKLKRDMTLAGFDTVISWNDRKTVHTAWVKVAGLLKETGLAAMTGQNLSIKLEIDSRPPAGAETVSTVINRHLMFALRHHSLSSLMAGKVHALMTRNYSKGRDWYDLLWYLSHRPPTAPNEWRAAAAC